MWKGGKLDKFHVGDGCFDTVPNLLGIHSSPEVAILFDPENAGVLYVRDVGPSGAFGRFRTADFFCKRCFDELWNSHVLQREEPTGQR